MIISTTGKIDILPVFSFCIDVYFSFSLFHYHSNLQLPILHVIPHTSQINSSNSMNSTEFKTGNLECM